MEAGYDGKIKGNNLIEDQKFVVDRLIASFRNNELDMHICLTVTRNWKRRIALFFAKLLLCENPIAFVPCETCSACSRVTREIIQTLQLYDPMDKR